MADSLRQECERRWEALKSERSSWMPHWQEISEVLLPRTGRFLVSETNDGSKRHRSILDNSGTRALRTLAGGMMAGMTSPARPWFRLTTRQPELDESYEVKQWLSKVTSLMLMIFNQSNIYRSLQTAYEELGAYGTTSVILLDDYDTVIHAMPLTIGEYAIATGPRGAVNTVYREFRMSVAAAVEEFGLDAVSRSTKDQYEKGNLDKWVTVVNAIEPRLERDPKGKLAKDMPYRSVYFERGNDRDQILRESGFRHFPSLSARWSVSGGDIYGTSPGMEALGDLKQLQQEQLCKSKAIAQLADPTIVVPSDLRSQEENLVPGGVVYADTLGQSQSVRAAYEVRLDLNALLQDIMDVRSRVDQAFYKDIFMMIAQSQNTRMTATEIAERHEEKMLMLGPVLERLNAEMLSPLISATFERIVEAGILPTPPESLGGIELNVDFTSILAQAQKSVTTNSIDRFVQNIGYVASAKPDVLDKFDSDYWADYYADALGIDPQFIVAGDKVALVRQQRAEQQAQAAQMEQAQAQASVARDLSAAAEMAPTPTNAEMMNQFSGY